MNADIRASIGEFGFAGVLIHDDQDPVSPQRGRFALEQIYTPEAVFHVAQEGQPRNTAPAIGGGLEGRPRQFQSD